MPTTYELSCPTFKIRVNKLEHGGWVAAVEMSLSKLVLSPPWLTVDQAKDGAHIKVREDTKASAKRPHFMVANYKHNSTPGGGRDAKSGGLYTYSDSPLTSR